MYQLAVKQGLVVTEAGAVPADIGIDGGTISAVGLDLAGATELDASGCYVIPGGVDPHVHLQMHLGGRVSADSFTTGTVAAACGGTTTIIDFAEPQPGQSMLDALAERRAEADGRVTIDYGLHMTVPTWHGVGVDRLGEVAAVVEAGCPTFKLYQAYDGMTLDDVALFRVLRQVGGAGGRVVLHSETGPVLEALRELVLAEGHTAPIWHEQTRPARLEATAIHRAAELADLAECPLYIFHVGCAEGIAEIVSAKLRGVHLHGETCPHYLLLNAHDHLDGPDGHLYICAPPLRTHDDQAAAWQALADGDLEVVSTDHCPWTRGEKKQSDFTLVPGGLPGIEARLALVHHFGVGEGYLELSDWVKVCCSNPARLMGLHNKGLIAPGYDADLVIFDPDREKILHQNELHEAVDWTPYEDLAVRGWPRTVLLRGKIIVSNEEFVGRSGVGTFQHRVLSLP